MNRPDGAFYMSVVFKEGRLNNNQILPIANDNVRDLVESLTSAADVLPDKRFVYYLLGATGICVVPLTSFSTELQGFRTTILETDEYEFRDVIRTLAGAIMQYLESSQENQPYSDDALLSSVYLKLAGRRR